MRNPLGGWTNDKLYRKVKVSRPTLDDFGITRLVENIGDGLFESPLSTLVDVSSSPKAISGFSEPNVYTSKYMRGSGESWGSPPWTIIAN